MNLLKLTFFIFSYLCASFCFAGPAHIGGKITSLMGSGSEPAIRLSGNVSPDNCDGGKYG